MARNDDVTMFAYGLYRFGAFLAKRMSLPTARRAAAAVGRFASFLQRRNRRHLYANLATAFGAAGSLVVTLVWFYAAAYAVLAGAVFSRAHARWRADPVHRPAA